ncbi:hypothetical protein [Aliiroseovarius crassostreae]|uniref:hypothetical protein n=1 Tax=Aliiroseovarius crassostreae TaxID=154981 RepID=UPI001F1585D6|nr:hypothetical protein [Aliiroseovarius crassostreae]
MAMVGGIEEVLQEAVPSFSGHARGGKHFAQFFDAVFCQRGDVFVGAGLDAYDIAIGKI